MENLKKESYKEYKNWITQETDKAKIQLYSKEFHNILQKVSWYQNLQAF